MKFKTFRVILIGAIGLTGVGVLVGASTCCKGEDKTPKKPEVVATTEKPKPEKTAEAPKPTQTAEPEKGDGLALRPMDKEILERLSGAAAGDKVKDAFPGKPYKVNLYKENGATKFNRVKIDLDRDDKWDEKWSVDDDAGQEVVKRQVAPNDDEKYTDEFRLKAGAWTPKKK